VDDVLPYVPDGWFDCPGPILVWIPRPVQGEGTPMEDDHARPGPTPQNAVEFASIRDALARSDLFQGDAMVWARTFDTQFALTLAGLEGAESFDALLAQVEPAMLPTMREQHRLGAAMFLADLVAERDMWQLRWRFGELRAVFEQEQPFLQLPDRVFAGAHLHPRAYANLVSHCGAVQLDAEFYDGIDVAEIVRGLPAPGDGPRPRRGQAAGTDIERRITLVAEEIGRRRAS